MALPDPDDVAPWAATLMALPCDRLTKSQHHLLYDLALSNLVKKELSTPITPSFDSRAHNILLSAVESYMAGPFEFSVVCSLGPELNEKLLNLAFGVYKLAVKRLRDGPELLPKEKLTVALATLLIGLLHESKVAGDYSGLQGNPLEYLYMLLDLNKEMDVKKEFLSESLLTVPSICHMLQFVTILINLKYPPFEFKDMEVAAKSILFFANASPSSVPPLYMTAACFRLYMGISSPLLADSMPTESWGVRLGDLSTTKPLFDLIWKAWTACVGMLDQSLEEAKNDNDAYLIALHGFHLAYILMHSPFGVKAFSVRAAAEQAATALDAARPWLPRYHKRALDVRSIIMDKLTEDNEDVITNNMCLSLTGESVLPSVEGPRFNISSSTTLQLRTCANCGVKSAELMACSGCRSVFFCTKRCQKLHWKSGHKKECAELKAKAQGAGGAAAATAAPAAGPSASASGSKEEKKKE